MKAVIMAGGEGTRLRPITCTMPKPMVPLLNKPVIDYCIELIRDNGIKNITATLQYLPRLIMSHCGSGERYGVRLQYSIEDFPLGTAGSVRKAVGDASETILVMSGDAMTDMDIGSAIKAHRENGARMTIVLKRVDAPMEYGVVLTREDGRIYRFLEKPMLSEVFSDLANTGIYIMEPEIIKMIPDGEKFDFSKDLFPKLMDMDIPIYGYVTDKYWCDIGDIAQYKAAQQAMLEGKCGFNTIARREGLALIEDGAMISGSAEILGPCYIGKGAEIGDMAVIGEYSVIGSGVRVGAHSSIKRTVLMEGARIRGNVQLRGAIICPEAEVDTGAELFADTVIGRGSIVGRECSISNAAKIWPDKRIDHREHCRENIKWTSSCRPSGEGRLECYSDTFMTPERAARYGGAFAVVMGKAPLDIGIASDGSQQGVMLKHSMISGILSQGGDVGDMRCCGRSAFEYGIRQLGYQGGIYICGNREDPHCVEISFCDRFGARLSGPDCRRLDQEVHTGEKKPLTSGRLGIVQHISGTKRAYDAHLGKIAAGVRCQNNESTIVICGDEDIYDSVARIMIPKGYRVRYSRDSNSLSAAMEQERAHMGFSLKDGLTATIRNEKIDRMKLMAVLAYASVKEGRTNRIPLPADMPREYIEVVKSAGAEVLSASGQRDAGMRAALQEGLYIPELFEPEAGIIRVIQLESQGKLMEYIRAIPHVEIREGSINCSWRDIGRLLRGLVDSTKQENVELIDGVKVMMDKGWVLVRPDNGFTACRIIAGSMDAEYSEELSILYEKKLRDIAEQTR